ncbi:MAG: TonB-dependent receptor [Acidobacteria bacterium]|nr:TonB-dependent receptor [Acidobacteriota bacterium]
MRKYLLVLISALSAGLALQAQTTLGTITGRVLDPSGASVSTANVTAANSATGVPYKTTTNAAGNYVLQQLAVGEYEVTVEAPGFRRYVRKGVPLAVAQTVTLDVSLEVGQVDQTVEVTSAVGELQTSTSDLGTTIDRGKLLELPLFVGGRSRDLEGFIFLAPGVTGDTTNTQISGSPSRSKEVLVDGIASTGIESGGVIPGNTRPSVETIGEFRLLRANFNAEYGRTGGGIQVFTTRSGTNAYHGAGFDFLRNDALDARGFFLSSVAVNRQNEFGASFGGPLTIPKVYDGKNRTFFFVVYGGYRYRQGAPNTQVSLIPTDYRAGNFANAGATIYDPATTQTVNGAITRTAFPGNAIPTSRFSSVSKAVLAALPTPLNNSLFNNFVSVGRGYVNEDQINVKIDHSFNDRHRLNGYFYKDVLEQLDPIGGGSERTAIPGGGTTSATNRNRNHWVRLADDYVISPAVLNHIGIGWTRFLTTIDSGSLNQDWPTKLGLAGVNAAANNSFPCIQFPSSGYSSLGHPNCNSRTLQTNNALQLDESLSLVRGSHSFKFGYEYRFMETNGIDNYQAAGLFKFNALETGVPNQPKTGNAIASFLLGTVDSGQEKVFAYYPRNRYQYMAGYAQDDWKFTRKLTLNYGLRYDLFFPRYEKLDNLSTFDPTIANPGAGGRPGALAFLGNGTGRNGRRSFSDTYYKTFAPRLGLAYQLTPKTVLRAGYGIYYAAGNNVAGLRDSLSQTYGYSANPVYTTLDQGATPAFNWDSGFPQNYPKPPFIDPTAANGQDVRVIGRNDARAPYFQNWSFTVQREFKSRMTLEMAYLGAKGTRLGSALMHINEVNPANLALGSLLSQQIGSAAANAAGIYAPYSGFKGSVAQSLRPYPQYLDLYNRSNPSGNSTYNSLQTQFNIRAAKGLDVQASYTWAKTITDSNVLAGGGISGQTYYNRSLEKAIADTDIPQILAIAYSYELPVGPGKLLNVRGPAGHVLGGWILTGIQQYSVGAPIVLTANNTLPLFTQVLRPNVVAGQVRQLGGGSFDPAVDKWINPAAFAVAPALQFGNSARSYTDLRAPNFLNENFGLMKQVKIWEKVTLTLRGEFFNAFNRVVFSAPQANVSNAAFGKISAQSNNPRQGQVAVRLEF